MKKEESQKDVERYLQNPGAIEKRKPRPQYLHELATVISPFLCLTKETLS